MAESKETSFAVIVSHSGIAYSPERDAAVGYMHDHIVDAGAAGSALADHLPARGRGAEVIEQQDDDPEEEDTDG